MRPLRLRLKGFTAFREEQEVDFVGVELFAIAGPTGSGKSSLLDAMTYALYGEVDRVGIQCGQLVSQGLPRMSVTLDFRVGDEEYRITRTTPASTGPSSVLFERLVDGEAQSVGEGADRIRDVKDLVKAIVGLDYDAFTRSILLPQNKFAEFMTGEATKRREILIDLLALGLFDRMAKRAGQIARDARVTVDDLGAVVEREYAGVDAETVRAAGKEAEQATELQSRVAKSLEEVREFANQAEKDRRAAADLATCGDEVAGLAETAKDASSALNRIAKLVTDADARVSERDKEAKALAAKQRAAVDSRAAAEKKWGRLSELTETKALASGLSRFARAAKAAELAVDRAVAQRPKVLKRQADGERDLAAAVETTNAAARELKTTKRALEEAEHADKVAAIAAGLKKGDPCPVCGQPLATAPKAAGSGLRAAKLSATGAEKAEAEAREALTEARLAKSEANKDLTRLDADLEDLRAKAKDAELARSSAERDVAKAFAGKMPEDPVLALQQRIDELDKIAQGEADARDAALAAERALAEERRKRDLLDAEVARERTRLEIKTDALFSRCVKLGVSPTSFPKLAPLPPAAKGIEATVAVGREVVATLTGIAEHVRNEAAARAKTERALLARALKAAEVLPSRATTLERLLAEVSASDRSAVRRAAEAKKHAEDLNRRLERREQMEKEIDAKKKRARTLSGLALELRADHIVAFLQSEALQAMASAASVHLAQLSDDRYRLVCRDDDEFFVLDGWTGDEGRSARTLSGGETFLASLALALGLAEQVRALSVSQRARLDSLFLDEGFGSLDPETLETASDAIQRLAGDGRLVGVVTHVSALSEQFTRIEVVKTPKGSSTLRFVSWPQNVTSPRPGQGVAVASAARPADS